MLNTICYFRWIYLLDLGLGVMTNRFPESRDFSLSIRVGIRVSVTINHLTESKERKTDLGEVGECNE